MKVCSWLLLFAALLCALPASGQVTFPGGSWVSSYTVTYTNTLTQRINGTTTTVNPTISTPSTLSAPLVSNYLLLAPHNMAEYVTKATLQMTWLYIDFTGHRIIPVGADAKLCLRETASASWTAGGHDNQGTVFAGTGDVSFDGAQTSTLSPDGTGGSKTSKRLRVYDGGSGLVNYTVTFDLHARMELGAVGVSGVCAVGCSYNAAVANRYVTLASSFDTTYHKGPVVNGTATRVANAPVYSGDFAMFGDTAAPYFDPSVPANVQPGLSVAYIGAPIGSWGTNSNQNWSASLESLINPPRSTFNDSPFNTPVSASATYTGNPSPKSGDTDTVTLDLKDSQDGYTATATYALKFHDMFDSWTRQTPVIHPLPAVPTFANHLEWNMIGGYPNSSELPQMSPSYTVTSMTSLTVTGSITIELGGGITLKYVNFAFKRNENITIGQQISRTTTKTIPSQMIPKHTTLYFFWGFGVEDRKGATDYYDAHGYNSTVPWNATVPQVDPDGQLAIRTGVWTEPLP